MPYADPSKERARRQAKWAAVKADPEALAKHRAEERARYQRKMATPEGRETLRRRAESWGKANPTKLAEAQRRTRIKRAYGITQAAYDELLAAQGGVCAICRREQHIKGHRLVIDHDHTTGEVRGLLCHNCNHGIGKFRDDPKLLEAAIAYLSRPPFVGAV